MPDTRDLFSEATERAELGRLDEALTLFQALLKTNSNNATSGLSCSDRENIVMQ